MAALKNLANFKSVKNFGKEILDTYTLVNAFNAQAVTTSEFLTFTKAKDKPDYQKFKHLLEIDSKQTEKLYELGFIALFANFECFMFEFLKELFKKYPTSFKSEKIIKFEDIKDFKDVIDIKDYFIDSFAIEKSYEIDTWKIFLSQKFGIKIFANKKDFERLKLLNFLRNLILHSGSKTNSKFRNDLKPFLKSPVPLGERFSLSREKYFGRLYVILKLLITNLEKN